MIRRFAIPTTHCLMRLLFPPSSENKSHTLQPVPHESEAVKVSPVERKAGRLENEGKPVIFTGCEKVVVLVER